MSAYSLKDIQQSFQQLLLKPSTPTPEWIISDQLSAQERVNIYTEGYRLRLCDALVNDFPAIYFLAGHEVFNQWCLAYIDAHPSEHFSLRYFGKHFSAFLTKQHEPLYAQLAAFEWALTDTFDAPDASTLTRESLAQLPVEAWETLTLTLHPSVCFLTLDTNAPSVWQQFKNENLRSSLTKEPESTAWLIWRQELKLFFRPLSVIEHQALLVMQTKGSWQSVCDKIATLDEVNAASLAANFLNTWVVDGVLRSL